MQTICYAAGAMFGSDKCNASNELMMTSGILSKFTQTALLDVIVGALCNIKSPNKGLD